MKLYDLKTWVYWLPALLVFVAVCFAGMYALDVSKREHQAMERLHVSQELAQIRVQLESVVLSSASRIEGLLAMIKLSPDLSHADYDTFASQLINDYPLIQNIAAAPDLTVKYMYPYKGNEAIVGMNYMQIPTQAAAAIEAKTARALVLAGPVNLLQGGVAFIARFPVFIQDNGDEHFWGLVSSVMPVDLLYEKAGLNATDLQLAIRGQNASGERGAIFYGDPVVFEQQPVLATVNLPWGSWQLAATPLLGWPEASPHQSQLILLFMMLALLLVVPSLYISGLLIQRRKNQQALVEALQQAERASHAKSDFLANMSHEIRTPMNGVLGLTDLAKQETDPDKRQHLLDKAHQSARLLLGILDDILDFSKIEAGKLSLDPQPFNVRDLLRPLIDLYGPMAQKKGLKLKFDIQVGAQETLISDAFRIRQVLGNLLSNAIKFTSQGEITLSVKLKHPSANQVFKPDWVCLGFSVQDTGIGLSLAQQQRLFQPFTQADESITRQYGGSGLGLVISQRLVNVLGGEGLLVSSELNQGALFSFSLPCERSDSVVDTHQGVNKRLDYLGFTGRILLVEDNEINQLVAKNQLEKYGLEVVLAHNGKQALELARQYRFDLIFMDIQMPVMDGYQATRQIRQFNSSIPIIALTAAAMVEDRQKALAVGMNDHLAKPLNKQALIAILAHYLSASDIRN